jgi:hypothetical protein
MRPTTPEKEGYEEKTTAHAENATTTAGREPRNRSLCFPHDASASPSIPPFQRPHAIDRI